MNRACPVRLVRHSRRHTRPSVLNMLVRPALLAPLFAIVLLMLTQDASAQLGASAIAGVVRDATGSVLPGVTVEVASPALIDKTRSVVTDGNGLYRVVDLRPGTYLVTFTLAGFNTVRREGIELVANFTATVNADLRVGGLRAGPAGDPRFL